MEQPTDASRTRHWAVVLFALVLPTFVTLAYFVWTEDSAASVQQITYAVGKVVQFALPVYWVCLIQRHRPRLWPWTTRGMLLGLVFGLFISVVMLVVYHGLLKSAAFFVEASTEIREKVADLDVGQPWKFVLLGIFYSLFHSLLEEYYWRWFVFGQLRSLTTFWPAVVVSSLGFMAHHVVVVGSYFGYLSPVTWFFSLSIAVGGAFWAWLYDRSGSLLGPWLGHLLIDAAIFAIGFDLL